MGRLNVLVPVASLWLGCIIPPLVTAGKQCGPTDLCAAPEACVVASGETVGVCARVARFQDGASPSSAYLGTHDTYLSENQPDQNEATQGADDMVDGDEPGGTGDHAFTLIRWDLAGLEPGARVLAVQLTFNVMNASAGQPYTAYLLRRDWTEGEATWRQASAGNPWETAGAQGSGDRGVDAIFGLAPTGEGLLTRTFGDAGVAAAQQWVDDPASNHGLILQGTSKDGIDLSSRENAKPALRPLLTITYLQGG